MATFAVSIRNAMALPTYRQVLDDPAFADADVQTQKSINDAYWKAHEAENPGDKWGAEMYDASTKSIEIKNEIADASPIEQRNLNLQRDALNTRVSLGVNLKEGAFKTTKEFTDAAASENLRLASERSKVVKTLSLNDPTVDAQMQPAWQALGKSALDEGIFDQKTLSPTAKPGRYAELKTELSTTFHLSPEEVDDVVKHRMGLQTDPVSRDAFGQVHIKPEVLAKPAAEIQKAIEASNLPASIKKREASLIPDKIEGFKSGFVDNVMKNQPEVAAYVGMSPDMTAEQNFGLLTDRLIQNFGYQGATGAVSGLQGTLADVAHGVGLFQEKFTGGEVPSMEKVSRDIESRSKINQQLTDLSYALNKEATTLWGTNAAVIGGGVESVVESAALGAITAPLAPQFALAKLAGSGKFGKFLVDGVNGMSKVSPVAGVFGARQGVQTYEQAKKAGMPEEDAIKFGIQSGAIETFTTMLFSGINLGGVEDIATGAARQRVAAEVVNKIRSTPWAFSKGVFKNVTGEVLEEDTIAALDSVLTQAKLNPNMTQADLKQALYDTTVATLAASGAFAVKAGYDQGSAVAEANRKISTAQQTDQQLEETADAIRLENLAKENLPEAQTEGGAVAPPSPERVAELQSQRAIILADLKTVPINGPTHEKLLDELDSVEGELSNVQNIPTPTGEPNAPEALQLPKVPTGEAAQPNLEPTGGTQKGTGVAETKVEDKVADISSVQAKWQGQGVVLDVSRSPGESINDPGTIADAIVIDRIKIPEDQQRSGVGSAVLADVKAAADAQNVPVEVLPVSLGKQTVTEIEAFYAANGFVPYDRGGTKQRGFRYTPSATPAAVPTESLPAGAPPLKEGGVSAVRDEGNAPQAKAVVSNLLTPEARALPPESFKQQKVASLEQVSLQNSVAKMYDALPEDDSKNPEVVKAYENLTSEVLDQHKAMLDSGLEIELVSESPYASSKEMIEDVKRGKLKVQRTDPQTFGSSPEVFTAGNHHMLKDSGLKDVNGQPMLVNDVFRGVHDYIAHAAFGSTFGPLGEEAAWKAHLATIKDPLARRALTTETRGQNSWVNYRDEMLRDGKPIKKGEPGYVAPQDRQFAVQKFALLPEEALQELTTTPTNENQVQKASRPPPIEGVAPVTETEGEAEAGTAQREGQGEEVNVPVIDPKNLRGVTTVMLDVLGFTTEEAAGITGESLKQESEPANTPNAQVTFTGLASALITYYKNANGSSAVHEPIHIARRFLLNRNIPADKRAGITEEMIDAANAFVGATDSNWTVDQEEKFARAFERYLWEGVKTDMPKVNSLFKQITNFMRDVYKSIEGSSLNVEMTPEVRQLFDKLITRGETLKAAGIAPTSIKVGVKVKKGKPQAKAATPEQLGIRKALLKSQAEAFGVAAPSRRVSMSDQEAIDSAESRLANPEARTGTKLVEHLLSDPTQTTDKVQHALLAHEMVVRSNQVDKVRQFSKRPDLTTQERVNNAAELRDAYDKLEEILDVIRFQGSKAGLALQAMKLVTNRKFELEQMLGDAQVWANDGSTTRVQLSGEQRQRVQEMHDKIKDLQKENDDLRAEAEQRIKELEKASVVAAQARDVKQKKVVKETERVRIIDEKLAPETALSRLRARGNLFGGTLSQEGEPSARHAELEAKFNAGTITAAELAEAQKLVDEAAKRAGHTVEAFHLTAGDFDTFVYGGNDQEVTEWESKGVKRTLIGASGKGFFFSPDKTKLPAAHNVGKGKGKLLRVFLKIKNPLVVDSDTKEWAREVFAEGYSEFPHQITNQTFDNLTKEGYDAIEFYYKGDNSQGDPNEIVVLFPEQIKSAEPFTGVPLSQRFDPESPSILSQSPEGLSPEVLDDLSIVGASFILHGSNTEAKFTEALVKEFGEDARPYGGEIFERSKVKLDKVRKIAKVRKSPQELKAEIDPNKELSGRMIFNMVSGYLQEGIPEEKVLARVHKELQDVWENLTFDEVSDAYTGYGKAKYPSSEELAVSLRHVRNIERIKRQIRVVEGGQAPKKSGVQRDKASERILELNKELAAVFKASGIVDTETNQLTSALGAIKTRFKNQIVEYTKAVKTLTRLPSNKRGVDYDAEATKLKAELDALRAEYTKIFENKTLTEKQKIERAATTLDRLIAEEEDMLAKGILSKPRTAKTVFTDPDIVARQERLKKLRTVRKAAIRALNPTKSKAQLAYEAALRENKKGLARDRQTVATGILPTSKRNVKTFTTTQELKDILSERETLKEIIKLHRGQKRRAESVSKAEEMRNQRAVEAAEKSLELIDKHIEALVSGTTPAATTKTVRPVNLAVTLARALRDSRRRTMQALEQYREGKRVDTLKKLEEFYADKIRRKDFRKEMKPPALLTKKISDAQFRADQAKTEWLKSRAAFMLEGAPWYKKAFRLSRGLLQLRKIISLGGDIGAVLRQVGVVTYRNVFHPVIMTRMFARALKAGFSLSEKAEYEIYQAISTAPEAMTYKQMGMVFHSPFDEAYGNKEDIPDPEFLNIIRNAPAWKSLFIGKGLAQVLSAAERFQRAYINQGRYEFMKALVASAGGIEYLTPQKMALIGNAVMVGTGRWSGNRGNKFEKMMEQAIPLLNSTIFISARYSLSRLAVAAGEPVWSLKGGSPTENLALRRKIALEIYGKSVIGRAVMITLTKMAYDAATGDDDDEERWRGVFNPRDKNNFMKVKVGKTRIDMSSGIGPYLSELKLVVDAVNGNAVKVNRDTGEVTPMKSREIGDELINFQLNRSNINAAYILRTFLTKEYYGGKPVTLENAVKELILPIMVNDTEKLYAEHGKEGIAIWAQMMLGDGVQPPSNYKKKASSDYSFKY